MAAPILPKKTYRLVDDQANALVGGHDPVYAIDPCPRIERHRLEVTRHSTGRRIRAEEIDRPSLLISDDAARPVWITPLPPRGAILEHADGRTNGPVDMENVRKNRLVGLRPCPGLPWRS